MDFWALLHFAGRGFGIADGRNDCCVLSMSMFDGSESAFLPKHELKLQELQAGCQK